MAMTYERIGPKDQWIVDDQGKVTGVRISGKNTELSGIVTSSRNPLTGGNEFLGPNASRLAGTADITNGTHGAVRNIVVCARPGGAEVKWRPPASGKPSSYRVTTTPFTLEQVVTGLNAVLTGLTNGVSYVVNITPIGTHGDGASAFSRSITPNAGPPGLGAITDLVLWYDATAESYSDGASVTSLTDRSGNGYNTDAVSASNPVFLASWQNSKAAVTFTSAGSKYLRSTLKAADAGGPMTVFIACQFDSVTGNKRLLSFQSAPVAGVPRPLMIDTNGTGLRLYSSPIARQDITVAATTPYVISFVCGGGTGYLNGAKSASTTLSATSEYDNNLVQALHLNCDFAYNLFHDTKIAEVMIYSRALTQAERWAVEAYLAAKYSITVVQA